MATSHLCNGKWRPGAVAECPKHTRLGRKQPSVYRSGDTPGGTGGSGSGGSSKSEG